jgi:hypothetical protein
LLTPRVKQAIVVRRACCIQILQARPTIWRCLCGCRRRHALSYQRHALIPNDSSAGSRRHLQERPLTRAFKLNGMICGNDKLWVRTRGRWCRRVDCDRRKLENKIGQLDCTIDRTSDLTSILLQQLSVLIWSERVRSVVVDDESLVTQCRGRYCWAANDRHSQIRIVKNAGKLCAS